MMKKAYRYMMRVLGMFLGMFSLTACYGVPYEVYNPCGRVTDSEDGHPVPGIRVTVSKMVDGAMDDCGQTLTGRDGGFEYYEPDPPFVLSFDDIDGAENGEYQSRSMEITKSSPDLEVRLDRKK